MSFSDAVTDLCWQAGPGGDLCVREPVAVGVEQLLAREGQRSQLHERMLLGRIGRPEGGQCEGFHVRVIAALPPRLPPPPHQRQPYQPGYYTSGLPPREVATQGCELKTIET